jgi:N-acetylglucosamine kinase
MLACADIGGSFTTFGHVRSDGCVIGTVRVPTPTTSWPCFVAGLQEFLRDAHGPFAAAIAGLVDPRSGQAICANIPCLNGRAIVRDLGNALGREVHCANDADCFTLAEALHGAARGSGVVFGTIFGTGVGGGLVIDGRLVRGDGGVSGEWGHGPISGTALAAAGIDIGDLACGCGRRGCLDTIGGARGLERLHGRLGGPATDSHAILADWAAGRPRAVRTVDVFVDVIADQLALIVNATGARVVPAGGGLASCASLMARIDRGVRTRVLRRAEAPIVVPGTLGPAAALIGAAALVRQPCET